MKINKIRQTMSCARTEKGRVGCRADYFAEGWSSASGTVKQKGMVARLERSERVENRKEVGDEPAPCDRWNDDRRGGSGCMLERLRRGQVRSAAEALARATRRRRREPLSKSSSSAMISASRRGSFLAIRPSKPSRSAKTAGRSPRRKVKMRDGWELNSMLGNSA